MPEKLLTESPFQAASSSKLPLFFQRRFFPMWVALSLGAFTDNMLKQALSIALVFGVISAPFISNDDALPLVGQLFPVAMFLFSTIAGQFADKNETSMMFRRTKFIEFLLMVLAAVGFLMKSSLILVLVLFLMGAQSAFFSPVRTAAMPKYLATDELVRGNAFCSGGLFVAVMLGIFIGGLLITQPGGRVLVSAILAAAALVGWLSIRAAPEAAANSPDLKIDWNIWKQAKLLIGLVIGARGVLRPVLGAALYWSIGALVSVSMPLFVRDTLGADESIVTILMGLFAIGAAIGAIIASTLSKGRSGLGYSAAGMITAAIMTFAVFGLSFNYPTDPDGDLVRGSAFFTSWKSYAICAAFFVSSIAMSLFAVPMQAAVQRRAPAEIRARVLAGNNMVNAIGAWIGALLVFTITRTSIDPVFVFLALGGFMTAIAIYMFRRKNNVPEGLFDEMLSPSQKSKNLDE